MKKVFSLKASLYINTITVKKKNVITNKANKTKQILNNQSAMHNYFNWRDLGKSTNTYNEVNKQLHRHMTILRHYHMKM